MKQHEAQPLALDISAQVLGLVPGAAGWRGGAGVMLGRAGLPELQAGWEQLACGF